MQATDEAAASSDAPPARAVLLDVACAAADAAATIVRARAGDVAGMQWQTKSHSDFVTDVDTAAERAASDAVHARLPGANVLGEELSPNAVAGGVTFVIDPLDGTTNFLHGYPVYAVSVAAAVDGVIQAGVVLDVVRGDRYTATLGGGARRNDASLAVSAIVEPSRALIGTGFPFKRLDFLDRYQRQFAAVMTRTSGVRRAGSAALDLADVANGRFEAFWELSLAPWDVAAGVLLVREAGGVVTDLDGRPISGLVPGPVVAGNPAMHAWLLETIMAA